MTCQWNDKKFQFHHHDLSRQQRQQQTCLQKRNAENLAHKAVGDPNQVTRDQVMLEPYVKDLRWIAHNGCEKGWVIRVERKRKICEEDEKRNMPKFSSEQQHFG